MLAIYLAAVIIPAGPHMEAPDPSLAWVLPRAQHPYEAVISKGKSTGPGSSGDWLSDPLLGLEPPWSPLCLGPKSHPRLEVDKLRWNGPALPDFSTLGAKYQTLLTSANSCMRK